MATEILRPQDCLRPSSHFYDPFSPPKPNPNRRRSRPAKAAAVSPPNSSSKHGRPNPKSARRGSPSSSFSSSSSAEASPSSSPPSTSPVHEGFRLLKRGEQFRPVPAAAQSGSEKKSPVESSSNNKHKKHELSTEASVVPPVTEKVPVLRRSELQKTQLQKKPQSDRVNKPDRLKSPPKPLRFGSDRDSCFAGPNFAIRAPEASCLPQPGFLLRSSSVGGPTSDDEASRALRSLLKLQFL